MPLDPRPAPLPNALNPLAAALMPPGIADLNDADAEGLGIRLDSVVRIIAGCGALLRPTKTFRTAAVLADVLPNEFLAAVNLRALAERELWARVRWPVRFNAFAERPIVDFVRLLANLALLFAAHFELNRKSDLKNDVLVLPVVLVAPEILDDLLVTTVREATLFVLLLAARAVAVFTAVLAVFSCVLACCTASVASAEVCVRGTPTVPGVDGTDTGLLAERPGAMAGAAVEAVDPSNELNTDEDVENGEGILLRRLGESLNRSSFNDLLTDENGSPESWFCAGTVSMEGGFVRTIRSRSLTETIWPAGTARP